MTTGMVHAWMMYFRVPSAVLTLECSNTRPSVTLGECGDPYPMPTPDIAHGSGRLANQDGSPYELLVWSCHRVIHGIIMKAYTAAPSVTVRRFVSTDQLSNHLQCSNLVESLLHPSSYASITCHPWTPDAFMHSPLPRTKHLMRPHMIGRSGIHFTYPAALAASRRLIQ